MKTYSRVASAALVVSCLIAGSANAQRREPVSARVSIKGLDLDNPKHRKVLDARIMRAANWACAPRNAELAERRDSERCKQEMRDSGRVAVAALMTPKPAELASAR